MTNDELLELVVDALKQFQRIQLKIVLGPVQVYQAGTTIRIDINTKKP